MIKPKMILFDYGQTLLDEEPFDGVRGTRAVLESCVKNLSGVTAEEIQAFAEKLNNEFGRFNPQTSHLCQFEIHNHPFQNYLYDYFGLERIVTPLELEIIFRDAASPAKLTENIDKLLCYLKDAGIRTGVISNISFSGEALTERINTFLPYNNFEFIIASSEYIFRKPNKRIFEIALKKAGIYNDDLECLRNDVWYCGDNPICDVDGASDAGLTPVWYKGAYEDYKIVPHSKRFEIYDWIELIDILEKCN